MQHITYNGYHRWTLKKEYGQHSLMLVRQSDYNGLVATIAPKSKCTTDCPVCGGDTEIVKREIGGGYFEMEPCPADCGNGIVTMEDVQNGNN